VADGLELGGFLAREFSPDFFEAAHDVGGIVTLAAALADLCLDSPGGGVNPASKKLFHFPLDELAAANRAPLLVRHSVRLSRQVRQRLGSGR